MKKLPLGLAALALLVFAQTARAVPVITFNENSLTRLDFNVVWGSVGSAGTNTLLNGGGSLTAIVSASDLSSIVVISVTRLSPATNDAISVLFSLGTPGRSFEPGDVLGFSGVQTLSLPGEEFGARFVYGTLLTTDPGTSVPDGGNTLMLVSLAITALAVLKRRHSAAATANRGQTAYLRL